MQSGVGQVLEFLSEAARRRDDLALKVAPKLVELGILFEPVAARVLLDLAALALPVNTFLIALIDGAYAGSIALADVVLEPTPVSRYALRYKGTPPNWPIVSVLTNWMLEHVRLTGYEKKESLRPLAKKVFGQVRMVEFEEAYTRAFRRRRGQPPLSLR